MRLTHAIMALILTAIFIGVVAGLASASVATAGSDAPVTVVATHRDTGSPALHFVDRAMLFQGDKPLKPAMKAANPTATVKASPTSGSPTPVPGKYTPRYAGEAGYKASPTAKAGTVKHLAMKKASPTASVMPGKVKTTAAKVKASPTATMTKASPTAKVKMSKSNFGGLAVKASPSAKPTVKGGMKYLAMKKASPTAKVKMSKSNFGGLAVKASPSAKPTAKGGMKYMITKDDLRDKSRDIPRATPSPIPRITTKPVVGSTGKPAVKHMLALPQGVKTPAENYGIYGLGGNVPTPTTAPTIRPVPSGSPTPVPGYYTPRYPGEAGAGSNVTVPPVPTPRPATAVGVPASQVSIPYAGGNKTGRGTIGTSNKVALSDDLRYAGRGPGQFGPTTIQTPASAPGPNSRPTAFVICRVCAR